MAKRRLTRIGFDLDGVIIDKPPLVPRRILELLVRSRQGKKLSYRYPFTKLERLFRRYTHGLVLRPPIKRNIEFLRILAESKKYELYVVSGRYSFLEDRTREWLRKHKIDTLFKEVFINLANQQPHFFKREKISDLGLDIFVEDDIAIALYLTKVLPGVRIYCFSEKSGGNQTLLLIESLNEIFSSP